MKDKYIVEYNVRNFMEMRFGRARIFILRS